MRRGRFRNQIVIKAQSQTGTSPTNQPIMEWTTFTSPLCEVWTRGSDEKVEGDQVHARTIYRFRCNHYDVVGVTAEMRIEFEGRTVDNGDALEIERLLPDYQKRGFALIEAYEPKPRI